MLVFASEFARELGRQGRATRVPLLLVLRDARHGIVTRDHLRRRDQIVAAIVVKGDRRDWRTITAEESDALIAAAVASGVAEPDPDSFADLDDTLNDFAHVEEAPAFLCPRCRTWSQVVAATWTNAPPHNPSAAPVWALCPGCFEALRAFADPNAGPSF